MTKLAYQNADAPLPRTKPGKLLARFVQEEEGALLVLSLFIFLAMFLSMAITFDFVRQEQLRKNVQSTADRAALAASDLSETRSAQEIATEFFQKEGLSNIIPVVSEKAASLNSSRTITIDVKSSVNRTVAELLAPEIRTLPVKVQSVAEESVGQVELSLVLDVSGSMVDPNDRTSSGKYRLDELKPAAVDFVEKLFAKVQPAGSPLGRLSISVVPYNQQVNFGQAIEQSFSINTDYTIPTNPNYNRAPCVDFFSSDFDSLAIYPSSPLVRTMYGDSWDLQMYYGSSFSSNLNSLIYQQDGQSGRSNFLNCYETTANNILPFSSDEAKVKAKINGLVGGGATAIDIGAKWGFALLDPAARPATVTMVTKGHVINELRDRPYDYSNKETLKIMVLMTDGANTDSYSTKSAWRVGNSPLYSRLGTNNLDGVTPLTQVNSTSTSNNIFYYDASRDLTSTSKPFYLFRNNTWYRKSSVGTVYPISYDYLYQTKRWNLTGAAELFRKPFGRNFTTQFNLMAHQSEDNNNLTSATDKDQALMKLCNLARKQGVVVFTIAVDAPTQAGQLLQSCATTPARAFDIESSSLDEVFAEIEAGIKSLRLTQ